MINWKVLLSLFSLSFLSAQSQESYLDLKVRFGNLIVVKGSIMAYGEEYSVPDLSKKEEFTIRTGRLKVTNVLISSPSIRLNSVDLHNLIKSPSDQTSATVTIFWRKKFENTDFMSRRTIFALEFNSTLQAFEVNSFINSQDESRYKQTKPVKDSGG